MRKFRFGLVTFVIALIAAACSTGNVASLAVGDCFMDPEDPNTLISDVEIVDCAEPHHNEVYAVLEVESFTDDFDALCLDEFEAYFDQTWEMSEVYLYTLSPTAEGFNDGDTQLVCAGWIPLDFADLSAGSELIEGSLQGSGR